MAVFQVWHNQRPTFMNNDAARLAVFPAGFTHVADVTTPDVGDAHFNVFQLTNHIDGNWLHNAEVKPRMESARSTSVGDVIVLTSPADGSIIGRWSVEMIGLKQF